MLFGVTVILYFLKILSGSRNYYFCEASHVYIWRKYLFYLVSRNIYWLACFNLNTVWLALHVNLSFNSSVQFGILMSTNVNQIYIVFFKCEFAVNIN
jgi:hypothetical protein